MAANFTRDTVLPFHAGAARWYNNNAVAGSLRGDATHLCPNFLMRLKRYLLNLFGTTGSAASHVRHSAMR